MNHEVVRIAGRKGTPFAHQLPQRCFQAVAVAVFADAHKKRRDAVVAHQTARRGIKGNHDQIILVAPHRGRSFFLQYPHDAAAELTDAHHLSHGGDRPPELLTYGFTDHAHGRPCFFFGFFKKAAFGHVAVVDRKVIVRRSDDTR